MKNIFVIVREGVWTLVPASAGPVPALLVDGVPTDEWYDLPEVAAYHAELPLRPVPGGW